MPLELVFEGDIFESGASALVNPVNCRGTMGAGLAAQFKRRYPSLFTGYQLACRRGELQPGRVQVLAVPVASETGPLLVVNFPTKDDWRDASRIEWIHAGLESLAGEIVRRNIPSVALPALGVGLGGLPWPLVEEAVRFHLEPLEARVLLYAPR